MILNEKEQSAKDDEIKTKEQKLELKQQELESREVIQINQDEWKINDQKNQKKIVFAKHHHQISGKLNLIRS